MGLFSRKSSDNTTKSDEIKKPKKLQPTKDADFKDEVLTPESQAKAPASKAKKIATKAAKGQAGNSYRLLLSPKVSEKAANLASGNVYVFNVPVTAEKIEIANAVAELYGVKVLQVRTARGMGKPVYKGYKKGRRNQWKKAFVVVKKGQTIDLYEGV
jgi:large subunit ribosomal protein L23